MRCADTSGQQDDMYDAHLAGQEFGERREKQRQVAAALHASPYALELKFKKDWAEIDGEALELRIEINGLKRRCKEQKEVIEALKDAVRSAYFIRDGALHCREGWTAGRVLIKNIPIIIRAMKEDE